MRSKMHKTLGLTLAIVIPTAQPGFGVIPPCDPIKAKPGLETTDRVNAPQKDEATTRSIGVKSRHAVANTLRQSEGNAVG